MGNEIQAETRFAILLFTDIVGSSDMKVRFGVPAYSKAIGFHNECFERISGACRGVQILQNMGDGYFAQAESVTEAVRFALLFQDAIRAGPWSEVQLSTRVGIHAGEVATFEAKGGSGILAPAIDLAARVMSLALGGQILLTRFPFDEARYFLREHPVIEGRTQLQLRWLAHGPYLFKGCDDPVDIFEVGADGIAPLTPPPDAEKAKRAIRPGEENTLGWRPAMGLEIPGRPDWRLVERLGTGGFGEVWTGEHTKLRERRAFKFCFDDERLRALKREVTLVRLLRSALGDRDDIVRYFELKLDVPPYYLESELAPHGNLLQWAEKKGGLAKIPLEQRIDLVAHTAIALAAAHSIGVLHKDIKPTNILIFDGPNGTARPRLVDFGIGTLSNPEVLSKHGVTAAGFTRPTIKHSTGTPTYSPPEFLASKTYTVQGDIYGLGVLLYQLVTARPQDPLAVGWERDVPDPLLRDDIALCVDGAPSRRFRSAADLATRLQTLEQRRAEEQTREDERQALKTTAYRLGVLGTAMVAAFIVLAILALTLLAVRQSKRANVIADVERQQRLQADAERKRAETNATSLVTALSSAHFVHAARLIEEGNETDALPYLLRSLELDPSNRAVATRLFTLLSYHSWWLPVLQFEHTNPVRSVSFSLDGNRIITTAGTAAYIWDTQTGNQATPPLEHEALVLGAEFGQSGTRVVTIASDNTACMWDARTGKTLTAPRRHELSLQNAYFRNMDQELVTVSRKGYESAVTNVWDVTKSIATSNLIASALPEKDAPTAGAGNLTGTSRDIDNRLQATAASRLVSRPLNSIRSDRVSGAFVSSADGNCFLTVHAPKTVKLWRLRTMPAVPTVLHSPSDPEVRSIDGSAEASAPHFSTDGNMLVLYSRSNSARLWDVQTGKAVGHSNGVSNALFSGDGKRVLTAPRLGGGRSWDPTGGALLATRKRGGRPRSNTKSEILVELADTNLVVISDALTGNVVSSITNDLAFSAFEVSGDGERVVTLSQNVAQVWRTSDGSPLTDPMVHEGNLFVARFSPDGALVATGGSDGTVAFWRVQSGERLTNSIRHADVVTGLRFIGNGSRLLTISGGWTSRFWDVSSCEPLTNPVDGGVSDDGVLIFVRKTEGEVTVFDIASGIPVSPGLPSGDTNVAAISPGPDARRFATTAYDGDVRVWDLAPASTNLPGWLPKLVEAFSGRMLNQYGVVRASENEATRLIQQIQAELETRPENTDWAIWARWLLSNPTNRTISPFSNIPFSANANARAHEATSLRQ